MRVTLDADDGVSWTAWAVETKDEAGDPTVSLTQVSGLDADGNRVPVTPEALTDLVFHVAVTLGLPVRVKK